jgi:ADP-ribosyl-[dinitrogen reductase] hydrolase
LKLSDKLAGCILCGAIGDAIGSAYENLPNIKDEETTYYFTKPKEKPKIWAISDDTQLTLATCNAIILDQELLPETFAKEFLKLYKQRKIVGMGASVLKSMRELEIGLHWTQVGRQGEYAAGNGAAMRIAPLAFCKNIDKKKIKEICSITHKNDEAYVGALSIVLAIKAIIDEKWTGTENLIALITENIPDTSLKDRLIEINQSKFKTIKQVGKLGNNGYVVNSVPLAIFAASKINEFGIEEIFNQLIEVGGDTDTNCSIAGQIIGTLIGKNEIPKELLNQLKTLKEYEWINNTVEKITFALGIDDSKF